MQTIKLNEGFDSLRRILKSKQIHPKSKAYVLYETAKHINGLQNKLHRLWSENMYLRKMVLGHNPRTRTRTHTHIAIRIGHDIHSANKLIVSEEEEQMASNSKSRSETPNDSNISEESNDSKEENNGIKAIEMVGRNGEQPLDLSKK